MTRTVKQSKRRKRLRALAKAAYIEGFMSSGEGYNGEILQDQMDRLHLSESQVDEAIGNGLETDFNKWYKTELEE